MPLLKNTRWELFARFVADGGTLTDAHVKAGFKPNAGNASTLAKRPQIAARISELKANSANIHANTLDLTRQTVLRELAKLGMSNMADFVRIDRQGQLFVDCSNLTRDQAAAIKEVTIETRYEHQIDAKGRKTRVPIRTTKLKLADKRAPLVDIGKELGMFKDQVEHSGKVTLEMLVGASYPAPAQQSGEKPALPKPAA